MLWSFRLNEEGLADGDLAKLVEDGRDIVDIIDSNILLHSDMIYSIPLEYEVAKITKKFQLTPEAAREQVLKTRLDNKNIVEAVKGWRTYRRSSAPLITDFTIDEIERVAREKHFEGSIRRYLREVADASDGLCIYLKTPFSHAGARKASLDLLPKRLKHIALKHFHDLPRSKDYDITLYYVALALTQFSDLKVYIISRDRRLSEFVYEINELLPQHEWIYPFKPQKLIGLMVNKM